MPVLKKVWKDLPTNRVNNEKLIEKTNSGFGFICGNLSCVL